MITLKHFERVFNQSSDCACLIGRDGFLKTVNPIWTTLLGWSEGEILNQSILSFVADDDQANFEAAITALSSGQNPTNTCFRFKTKEGHYRSLKWNFIIEENETSILALVNDISELLDYQSQLDHKAVLTQAINTAQSLYITEGCRGNFPGGLAKTIINTLNADVVFIAECRPESEFNQKLRYQWTGFSTRKGNTVEVVNNLASETKLVSNLNLLLTQIPDVKKNAHINQPVLERLKKRLTPELELLNTVQFIPLVLEEQLYGVIAVGWHNTIDNAENLEPFKHFFNACAGIFYQIHQRQWKKQAMKKLTHALEEAKLGIKAKGEFLATMSHEIRTPLNGLLGMTELLCDSDLTAEQQDYVSTIKASGESLQVLLNDILDYSKIDAQRVSLEEMPCNIRETVESIFSAYANNAHNKGLRLLLDVEKKVPETVTLDPTRLRQILSNLIDNAIKFTPEGAVTIKVNRLTSTDIESGQREDKALRFIVEDSGIGMSKEQLSKIFMPFTQGDTTMTRRFGGTGLGLAISKQLVELMGGNINVNTTEEQGSCFEFTLPVNAQQPYNFTSEIIFKHSIKPLLLVSNDPYSAPLYEKQCLQWGYDVTTVKNVKALKLSLERYDKNALVVINTEPSLSKEDINWLREQPKTFIHITPDNLPNETIQQKENFYTLSTITKPSVFHGLLYSIEHGENFEETTKKKPLIDPALAQRIPLNILVVEDNRVNQTLITALLKKLGYATITIAVHGEEAVKSVEKAVENNPFDLVLMDIQMPVMDGYEATKAIRNSPLIKKQPTIIALTAGAMADDEQKCLAAGMDDYLTKPIKIPNLIDAINHLKVKQPV